MAIKLTPGGANDDAGYRITSASPLGSFTDVTISCWVYIDNLPGNNIIYRINAKKVISFPWVDDWTLAIWNNTGITKFYCRIANGVDLLGATTPLANTWYHLALVFNDALDNTKLYLNGIQDASQTTTVVLPNSSAAEYWIGYRGVFGAEVFDGKICEVAVWASALSANQILMLSKGVSPIHVNGSTLRGYWPLYSGITTNPDYSGNVNNVIKFTEGTATVTQADHAPIRPSFGFDMGWQGNYALATKFPVPHLWWSEA